MQFSLFALLMAFLLMALSLAVFGRAGVVVGPILIGIVAYARSGPNRVERLLYVFLVLFGGGCVISLLCVPIGPVRSTACRIQCQNNLKQIDLALSNYRESNRKLPPIRHSDGQGKPLYSWRVLILPFIEQQALAASYKRAEPWNGPNNSKLAGAMPGEYCCPSFRPGPAQDTTYLAVVGEDGNWLAADAQFSNPVRVIEAGQSLRCWMEPRDVSLEDVCKAAGSAAPILTSDHVHSGGFFYYDEVGGGNAVFADGQVRWIPARVPADVLRAALRGDPAARAKLDDWKYVENRRINWPNCAALASLILCVGTMLFWPSSRRDARD